jgi:glycerophosphoryl diester phosphodiesterase
MKIVAHRGASSDAPENTLAAFALARELGADAIEFDVHITSDNKLVVLHDHTLDRTTNGTGYVGDALCASVCGLDAGSWFDPRFCDARIPTVHDVLALQVLEFEFELKGEGPTFLDAVARAVDVADVYNRVEFTSSNTEVLRQLKQLRPAARIGLFNKRPEAGATPLVFEERVLRSAASSGADVVHVFVGAITERIAARLHDAGFHVHANDADTPDHVKRALESGADRLSTRDVRMAVEIRSGWS